VLLANYPDFLDIGDRAGLRQALERSRRWLERKGREHLLVFGPREVVATELAASLKALLVYLAEEPPAGELATWVIENFDVLESVGDWSGEMLITGYYEPEIEGSRRRTARCSVPVLARPSDLIEVRLGDFREQWDGERLAGRLEGKRLVPYPNRAELRQGRATRLRTIAWACARVELFFVEIQGSGVLLFADDPEIAAASEMRIGYAGSNGQPYRSIGRLLIDEGEIPKEKMSMQALRSWLAAHPGEVDRVLDHNESVVFFRRLEGPPTGSLGLAVTAERSIASDHRLFPPGALAFLVSEIPATAEDGSTVAAGPLQRFVLNQDTGGAIRGAARADFFWGRGPEQAHRAGLMKQPGRLYFLVPKMPDLKRPGAQVRGPE
jgi:membrane-bound lytic murein transglycosylase A